MNIVYDFKLIKEKYPRTVITTGTFDGVHLGHQAILTELKEQAEKVKATPVVFTFLNHPRRFIFPNSRPKVLMSSSEKIATLSQLGIENIVIVPFNKSIASLSGEDFLEKILHQGLNAQHVILGYDNAFGKNRSGTYENLLPKAQELGVSISQVKPLLKDGKPISSTWIRSEIEDGNLFLANELLGRKYSVTGEVIFGMQRGGKMGFPTANVFPNDQDKILPPDGVYAVKVEIENSLYQGMLNIGTNPTFANVERSIEVNIFDFADDLYGKFITVHFVRRVRGEIKFNSIEELVAQIKADQQKIKEILAN